MAEEQKRPGPVRPASERQGSSSPFGASLGGSTFGGQRNAPAAAPVGAPASTPAGQQAVAPARAAPSGLSYASTGVGGAFGLINGQQPSVNRPAPAPAPAPDPRRTAVGAQQAFQPAEQATANPGQLAPYSDALSPTPDVGLSAAPSAFEPTSVDFDDRGNPVANYGRETYQGERRNAGIYEPSYGANYEYNSRSERAPVNRPGYYNPLGRY